MGPISDDTTERPGRVYVAPPDARGLGTRWYTTPVMGRDTAAYVHAAPADRMHALLDALVRQASRRIEGGGGVRVSSEMIEEARTLVRAYPLAPG